MTLNTAESWLTHLHSDRWSGALIILALIVLAGLLLSHLLQRALRLIVERDHGNRLDRMSIGFLSKVASAFVWIMILMFYAHMIPAFDRLTTALASVSVASVVFGLAAQSTLSNFVAGFSPIFYRPFQLGEKLHINAPGGVESGVVEDVSLGYPIMRTYDNPASSYPTHLRRTQRGWRTLEAMGGWLLEVFEDEALSLEEVGRAEGEETIRLAARGGHNERGDKRPSEPGLSLPPLPPEEQDGHATLRPSRAALWRLLGKPAEAAAWGSNDQWGAASRPRFRQHVSPPGLREGGR